MKNLIFVQLQKENEEHYILLESLMIPYNIEIDSHHNRKTPTELIQKITRGMLNMQGDSDRHLELCYEEEKLIGFLYGKVDHVGHKGFIKPEYGYIMEFYIKPEHRRNGYGKAIFQRLEQLLASHGTKRMYLTSDPVTSEPFWKAMGFESTGEVSPENGLLIFEKDVSCIKDYITIFIMSYPTDEMIMNIASHHGNFSDRVYSGLKYVIGQSKLNSDYFGVFAKTSSNNIIGCVNFIKDEQNESSWFYTDLWVDSKYRRTKIATKIVRSGIERLTELGAKQLYCTVDENNIASLSLQESIGFSKTSTVAFNGFETDAEGLIMF